MKCGVVLTALQRSPVARLALGSASAVVTLSALGWWLAANRVALDLASWCECASSTVTTRVIGAPAPHDRRERRLGFGDLQRLADHQAARQQEEQRHEMEAHAEPAHREERVLAEGEHQQSEGDDAGGHRRTLEVAD